MSTRTDTLFPYTTLFLSGRVGAHQQPRPAGDRHGLRVRRDRGPAPPRTRPPHPAQGGKFRPGARGAERAEEHTSELQSLMRISYAVFCLKKKNHKAQEEHK